MAARKKTSRRKAARRKPAPRRARKKKASARAGARKKRAAGRKKKKAAAKKKPVRKPAAPRKAARRAAPKPVRARKPAAPPAPPSAATAGPAPRAPAVAVGRSSVAAGVPERVGLVTHYFAHANAAIVALDEGSVRVGDTLHFRGHTTDFYQRVERVEIDHQPVEHAGPGQEVGIQVSQRVRENDVVFRVTR
jgi:putative protease